MATDTSSDLVARVRRLQREGKVLRRRFLPASKSEDIAKRDAVDYANACGWNNPSPGADDARKAAWATRWLALFASKMPGAEVA